MDDRMVGLIGGVAGGVLGMMGGIVGTYFGIRNTAGSRERAFMIRVSAVCWIALIAFLGMLWLTPGHYRPLLWLPYILLLPWAIRASNRRQDQIRREEASDA